MNAPRVSVLIVSYNRADDLALVLRELMAGSRPPDEIVVVDNASHDGSADVAASFPGVIVQRNARNEGFATGNNQALALATGDYIALLNNDAVPHRDWLRRLIERLESDDDVAGVGGKAFFWDDQNPVHDESNHYYSYSLVDEQLGYSQAVVDGSDEPREVATLSGCAALFRRSAIDAVGHPFLEPLFFTYYEETDFCARALRQGFRLFYDGSAAVWHRVRASTASYPYHYYFHMARNRILYAARNFDEPDLRWVKVQVLRGLARDLSRPWSLGKDTERRARVDAARWMLANGPLLHAHRMAVWSPGRSYQRLVRELQGRSLYYDHDRPEVRALVPADAREVLDVGCGAGALGAALRTERPGVRVRGIEPSTHAELAASNLDDAVRGQAEGGIPGGWPRPDCIIFADVLEHLVDPWTVLRQYRKEINPGGSLVVSLPNIRHGSVLFPLLGGQFDYADAGVLDRTHLRFFTPHTALQLLRDTGWKIEHAERVVEAGRLTRHLTPHIRRAESLGATPGSNDIFSTLVGWFADVATIQVLIRARPV